jgi:Kef-type K+ transport system membrane component KefB
MFPLSKRAELALLSMVFFLSMVGHEVVIESIWESFKTDIPDGIAAYITLFQFTFVGLGALTVETFAPTPTDASSAGRSCKRCRILKVNLFYASETNTRFTVSSDSIAALVVQSYSKN